ncbi:hypothetical protein OQA88_10665 [Cercophora sp. LCS_1]
MIATSTVIPTVTCDGSKSGDFAFKTVPDPEASITAFSLFAPMIQINWQSSDRPSTRSATTTGPGATRTNDLPAETSGTKVIDPDIASGAPTLETDGSVRLPTGALNGTESTDDPANDADKEESTEGETGLATTTKVGLSIAGAVAAVAIVVGSIVYVWRRRRHHREDQELDRLYGMKHNSSSVDLTGHGDDEIPGWYRGQRQLPTRLSPTQLSPFRPDGPANLEVPQSPYYRPYRP